MRSSFEISTLCEAQSKEYTENTLTHAKLWQYPNLKQNSVWLAKEFNSNWKNFYLFILLFAMIFLWFYSAYRVQTFRTMCKFNVKSPYFLCMYFFLYMVSFFLVFIRVDWTTSILYSCCYLLRIIYGRIVNAVYIFGGGNGCIGDHRLELQVFF